MDKDFDELYDYMMEQVERVQDYLI